MGEAAVVDHPGVATPDIVVVDDNEDALVATSRILTRQGWHVAHASDGAGAWRLINERRPRLVLLDVVLPDESGFDVLRRIRSEPDLDEMPVLMLSSMRTSLTDRTTGLNSGADGYIVRPIDNDELVAVVRAQLRQLEYQRSLQRSEQRYRDIIDSQDDAVLIVDHEGMVRYANPSADRIFARDPGVLVGRPFGVPVSTGRPVIDLRRDDGTSVAAEMSVVDTSWDDVPAWLVTLHDISERLRMEEQLRLSQRLESVGRLTGGIAHDFNNLLAIILGASSELTTLADDEVSELSEMITHAAERGADLTNRLLAFASRQFLEPDHFDVRELVRALLPVLRRALGDRVEIELLDDSSDAWALIDRAGIESAILNLCLNGRDAMQADGRLVIRIAHHSEPVSGRVTNETRAPGEYLTVSVTDHGEGISPERLEHVLEPFYTTKPPGVGTGLGLPMVYGFVRQSGGDLGIESHVGVGTTVTMFLPSTSSPTVGAMQPSPSEGEHHTGGEADVDGEDASSGRATVLVVDDDELLLNLVVLQVERLGHHAIGVGNVDDALRLVAERPIDLLLCDVRLGGDVSGNELASQILEGRNNIAVVMMSGLVDDAEGPAGSDAMLLGKPFTHAQLGDAIDRALG